MKIRATGSPLPTQIGGVVAPAPAGRLREFAVEESRKGAAPAATAAPPLSVQSVATDSKSPPETSTYEAWSCQSRNGFSLPAPSQGAACESAGARQDMAKML